MNANKSKKSHNCNFLFVLTRLLRPFSVLYGRILAVRNWLYDKEIYSVFAPVQRTISVGNITVGGTGKTPLIEFLASKLLTGPTSLAQSDTIWPMATLSRGYGRRTSGFRIATPSDTAETLGDEPLQLYQKFGQRLVVAVAERRVLGLQELARLHPDVQLVLLDDAFQHRAVQPGLNILLTDYNRPFYRDHPFPEGRLREGRHGARRADLIIVTKCPDGLSGADQQKIRAAIEPYKAPDAPVFFAGLRYGEPRNGMGQVLTTAANRAVVLVSGLANADPLDAYVRQVWNLRAHHRFNDHHEYTRTEIDQLLGSLPDDAVLMTTEKDWVKLRPLLPADAGERAFYLPIAVQLLGEEADFWARIEQAAFLKNS
ncbi:tetraacyldisaccharide 4'-kinase [Rudanella lutea]|uniref:tetraacyldisaccharide 4'-kinase n=1 Tax=Rudanella lutea TaxID=451374 RepID=UPI00036AAFA7|nr:tetraacyldisaccharide 4'-kinase [Rudanella lutea]